MLLLLKDIIKSLRKQRIAWKSLGGRLSLMRSMAILHTLSWRSVPASVIICGNEECWAELILPKYGARERGCQCQMPYALGRTISKTISALFCLLLIFSSVCVFMTFPQFTYMRIFFFLVTVISFNCKHFSVIYGRYLFTCFPRSIHLCVSVFLHSDGRLPYVRTFQTSNAVFVPVLFLDSTFILFCIFSLFFLPFCI